MSKGYYEPKKVTENPSGCYSSAVSDIELDSDWSEISSLLSDIKPVVTEPPEGIVTNKYTTGMLMGNGEIGVVAGDTVNSQKFYFGKSDFWGKIYNPGRDNWQAGILSLGGLTLRSSETASDAASVYRMEQDLLNAEVRTRMKFGDTTVHMASWTSDSEDVFVTELSSLPGDKDVALGIDLWIPDTYGTADGKYDCCDLYPYSSGTSDQVLWVTRENCIYASSHYRSRAAIAVKLLGAAFSGLSAGSASANGSFTLKSGNKIQIVTVFKSGRGIGSDCPTLDSIKEAALEGAAKLSVSDVATFKNNHRDWWKNFWLKSHIRVYDNLLEKYYYGAMYVLGCSFRQGTSAPPSIWSNWITTDVAAWGGRYFLNYNAEAPLYGVCSSNRPEMTLPYNDVIFAELPYQQNRTHAAGYKGASYSRTLTPFSLVKETPKIEPVAPERNYEKLPADQKSNGSFAIFPAIWYYEYTQDVDYLGDKLYPHLKVLIEFWLDYVTKVDTEDGNYRYDILHSSAHEGTGGDVNPSLDIGYIKRITRFLIEASATLGVDKEIRPVWQDLHDHIAPLPTGVYDGLECFLAAERVDPNQLHDQVIEPGDQPIELEGSVHPGELVALGGNEHEIEVAKNTLKYMNSWSHAPWNQWKSWFNGFCKVYPMAARLGWDAEDFIEKFKTSITLLWRESNYTVFQGGGGIETSGSIEAVNSMLMQSEFGVIKVFPVWPSNKDAYFKRLRGKGAFVVSSEFKEGEVRYIDITSEKGNTLTIKNPWSPRTPEVAKINPEGTPIEKVPYTIDLGNIMFKTAAGSRYLIKSR